DRDDPESSEIEAFHIGRLAVSDEDREPVVVDWRAPVAEPFYRATGRDPMGLVRRRHFVVEGRSVLGLEDELFGEGHIGIGDDGLTSSQNELRGYSTLVASLERGRTGTLGDIVATIQAEQDEIIRSPQSGVLVVQGGPGTGKTVVALHRAAYLLYTHRFPLEDQGVLVIGPNRVFLRYIEQVLPSLGEAGIEQVVLADLIPGLKVRGTDTEATARVKGKREMSRVIDRAIRDRERPLRDDVTFPFRSGYVRLRAAESEAIIKNARRGQRRHNAARRHVENEIWSALAANWRESDATPEAVRAELRGRVDVREMFERMWPLLTPAELLHDLYGSIPLIRSASGRLLSADEQSLLHRPRMVSVDEVEWTAADVALLDD
ncbi:MAG: DNA/RNA helicase domain-containing protein, partial [Actinomycetota bacterium]|nr:DNA/RNA helicase domain-containing protein [Actinomycetota bacterium]